MRKAHDEHWLTIFAIAFFIIVSFVPVLAQQPPKQDLPDAPSASKPADTSFPKTTPPVNHAPETPQQDMSDANAAAPKEAPPPMPKVKTAPPGAAGSANERDQLMADIRVNVNLVVVPVTVKDESGRIVNGLLRKDFSVYEDGAPQNVTFFTSDPFPMAVAVLVDIGMPETALRKVKAGLDALTGAFTPYDQVAVYTYAGNVRKELDFTANSDQLLAALHKVEQKKGMEGGFAVAGGPLNVGPTVNGQPYDPGNASSRNVRPDPIIPKDSRALNDAILAAALDLAKTDKAKRRVILVISDGKEVNSQASYSDVLKVLLSHEITVYGLGVDAAAMPLYRKLATINVPGTATADQLAKYVSATGGQMYAEFTRNAIESAYADITQEARNLYTIGYSTRSTVAGNYRQIEVRVHRPGLKVFAKDGYYPLPERP